VPVVYRRQRRSFRAPGGGKLTSKTNEIVAFPLHRAKCIVHTIRRGWWRKALYRPVGTLKAETFNCPAPPGVRSSPLLHKPYGNVLYSRAFPAILSIPRAYHEPPRAAWRIRFRSKVTFFKVAYSESLNDRTWPCDDGDEEIIYLFDNFIIYYYHYRIFAYTRANLFLYKFIYLQHPRGNFRSIILSKPSTIPNKNEMYPIVLRVRARVNHPTVHPDRPTNVFDGRDNFRSVRYCRRFKIKFFFWKKRFTLYVRHISTNAKRFQTTFGKYRIYETAVSILENVSPRNWKSCSSVTRRRSFERIENVRISNRTYYGVTRISVDLSEYI